MLRNTPGITMSIGEGASGTVSFGDNIFIRGFNVRNDIYIDGARDPGEVARDTFNVEAVEVAKGPTSVTGGRGSTGGSINMVTKAATLTDSASGRLTFGNADHKRASFDVNHRLTDTIAFRVNGMWQDAGYPGREVQQNKAWGFAPSIGIGIGKPTRVTVSYSRLKQNNVPDLGIPTLFPDNAIAAGLTVNDLDFSNYYSIASRDYENTTSDVVTGIVEHRFNSMFTLRNLTRYGNNYRDAVSTPPRPVTTAANAGHDRPRLQPERVPVAAHRHQVPAPQRQGHDQPDRPLVRVQDRQACRTAPTSASSSPPIGSRPTRSPICSPTGARRSSIWFTPTRSCRTRRPMRRPARPRTPTPTRWRSTLFDTVHFNEHWQADLGIRYDHVKIDYETVSATGVVANFGRLDKATTGRAGLVYKPVEKGSIYTAFSTSFAPVYDATHGLTLSAAGATSQALGPERSRNFEIGTKWDLGGLLNVTAAYFNLEKTDAKTTDLAGAVTLLGDQGVNGVEFTVAGMILPRLNVYGGVSFMDGEVNKSAQPSEEGVTLPYVPKAMLNLWSTYELPMRLTVGGGVNYSERQLLQPDRLVQLRRRRHGVAAEVRDQRGGDSGADQVLGVRRDGELPGEPPPHVAVEPEQHRRREVRRSRPTTGTSCPAPAGRSCSARCSRSRRGWMLLQVPEVLTPEQVAHARRLLDSAEWVDGRVTAGRQSARVKDNQQLPEGHPVAQELGDLILTALQGNRLFVSAALPLRVFPPLFNRYQGGHAFGNHVDNAIRQITGTPLRIRTDLSATLFLASPTNTTAANWWSRTPTACTASSCRRAT